MNFNSLVNLILEKNYDEAWELFHLKGQDVRELVKNVFKLNYPTPEAMDRDPKVDKLAHQLGAYMDRLPVVSFPWNQIPALETMDPKWVKQMLQIQNLPNAEQAYIELMNKRDEEGGPRPGGKKGNDELINDVKNDRAEPVVILKMPSKMYAVGGRTRMFAALALKKNIRAIILTPENLVRFLN